MSYKSVCYFLFSLTSLTFPAFLQAQDMVLVVERCKSMDQTSPIHNIWVDDDNVKWVANSQGLFKVLALDLVQKVSVPTGMTSLLDIRGGNANIQWNTADMQSIIGNSKITCASYEAKSKTIWIGTQDRGAFQMTLDPLRIRQQFNTDNKRLASNQINDIYIQPNGKTWIATNDGMLTGNGDKWDLEERYLNFIGVDAYDQNLWILGDDFLWQVDSKGKWISIAIEPRNVEGQLRDIAVDARGRVWIASNMMTGYDVTNNRYQRFGPGQYFTSQFVNCLDVDHDGSIWTGTDDKGLYLIQWEDAMTVNILMDTPLDCKSSAKTAILSVKVTGGTAPYTYKWNSGQTTQKINQVGPGTYTLTVTDSKSIAKVGKYEIPDPNLHLKAELVTPSSGNPEGDGSVNLLVDGGSNPMTYAWDNGETKQVAVKLTAGDHKVTVTDASGCTATTTIGVPEKILPLVVFAKFVAENKCADAKAGVAEVDVSGGKGPFQFLWSPGGGTDKKITGLSAGLYSVTVTDSKGQTASTSVNIPSPSPMNLSIEMNSLASVNMSNGVAEARVTGGRSPYTYHWDNGDMNAKSTSLSGGIHTITVTDGNGCTVSGTINVNENIGALGVIIKQPVKISCHGQDGASLKVEITGGKAPYTYHWNDGQSTPMLEKLKAGNYSITVTDAAGSTFKSEIEVTEPSLIDVHVTVEASATTGHNDGKATVKAVGGTSSYQYAWDNGEKTGKAMALSPGIHRVTVTDAAGCSATGEVEIKENITELSISIEQLKEVQCAGNAEGSIKANVTGGKPPYRYQWSNDQTTAQIDNLPDGLYKLTITDAADQLATSVFTVNSPPRILVEVKSDLAASTGKNDGHAAVTVSGGSGKFTYAWDNGETAAKALALGAGHHIVTVKDEHGCTAQGEITITENILPIAVKLAQTGKIKCAGDADAALESTVSGGKPPYTYQWKSKIGTWSTANINQLKAGIYSLSVTDASGLSGTADFEITEPKKLEMAFGDITPASTNNKDGKVVVHANGGTADYTMEGKLLPAGSNTFTFDRLEAGKHLIVVIDAMGCKVQDTVLIPENILPLNVTIFKSKAVLCHGNAEGGLGTKVDGGKGPYIYKWSNGVSDPSMTNLKAGKYSLTVTDAAGQSKSAEYSIDDPPALALTLDNIRSATNDRIHDGKANVIATGGTGAFTYQWSSGETFHQATQLPLGPGKVIVTDQNLCTAVAEFTITQKVLPELTTARLASGEPIRMEKIQFAADSVNINDEAKPSLEEVYDFLYDNPTVIIEVAGHTNGLPSDDYCNRISTERANAVANYIINKGIEPRRVIAKGYGKTKPVATNQTPEGRRKNQRVEIRLIKIEE